MKTLICEADSRRSSLCMNCKKKLAEGKITEKEVEASRLLTKMSRKFFIGNFELKRVIEMPDVIFLVVVGEIGALIGKGGKTVAELSKELGKKVRVIEKTKDEKKMIQDLVGEARVLGVNKIFKKEGQEHKILIKAADKERLITDIENLKNGIENLLNTAATIEFV